MNTIYGVDSSKPVTPIQVRDAIIECFFQAHCAETELGIESEEKSSRSYCKTMVKNAFKKTGGDFDHPTKQSILDTMNSLAEFSLNFRDQKTIKKHIQEIGQLIEKLPN